MRVTNAWVKSYSTEAGWDPVTRELAQDLGEARARIAQLEAALKTLSFSKHIPPVEMGVILEALAAQSETASEQVKCLHPLHHGWHDKEDACVHPMARSEFTEKTGAK